MIKIKKIIITVFLIIIVCSNTILSEEIEDIFKYEDFIKEANIINYRITLSEVENKDNTNLIISNQNTIIFINKFFKNIKNNDGGEKVEN